MRFAPCLSAFPIVHLGEWDPRIAPMYADWFQVDRCRNLRPSRNLRMKWTGVELSFGTTRGALIVVTGVAGNQLKGCRRVLASEES